MNLSGFTFVHNALAGGYPIAEAIRAVQPYVDEVVAVDMESTDGTYEVLRDLGAKVIASNWAGGGRGPLHRAFEKHADACQGEVIIFFEADEVYEPRLVYRLREQIMAGQTDLGVWRIQIEQNFQRVRWYPIPVHRVFRRGHGSYCQHPTMCPPEVTLVDPAHGLLWDVTNCFRDNWFERKAQQAELWGTPRPLMVPEHFTHPVELRPEEEARRLGEPHWEFTSTPLAIPEILKPLVGVTRYEVK